MALRARGLLLAGSAGGPVTAGQQAIRGFDTAAPGASPSPLGHRAFPR